MLGGLLIQIFADRFDPNGVQAMYPGVTLLQLEPGPIKGQFASITIDRLQINSGSTL